MRLIDADALFKKVKTECNLYGKPTIGFEDGKRVINWIEQAPTVDVLQKLWNALYAEEDKFEKRYISTPEHDNWFSVYRPWLQDGFGIAIKVLSEIFAPEPPKENVNDNMDV